MSSSGNNPPNFRLPINIRGKVHPDVERAISLHDDAITDLQQAIPFLKSSIDTNTDAISAAGSTTGGGTETVVVAPAQPSANVIGVVNDQSGNTSYTTQLSDYGAFVILDDASPVAVTLIAGTTISTPWFCNFINLGAGTVTFTPATGSINGPTTLPSSTATSVAYDGSDFWVEPYPSAGGVTQLIAGSGISLSPPGGTGIVTVSATASGYSLGGTLSGTNIVLGTGAGTGATVSVSGVDGAHLIAIMTGTGCVAGGVVYTLTFTAARSGDAALLQPAGGGLGVFSSLAQVPYVNSVTTSDYHVIAGTTALSDTTGYTFYISAP